MGFLYLCLSMIVNRDDKQIQQEFEDMETFFNSKKETDTELRMIYKSMTPGLYENFINGYKKAISKYGVSEGINRIKEKIIDTIIRNRPGVDRESLLNYVSEVDKETRRECILDMMIDGLHFQKDENGNYTMEE